MGRIRALAILVATILVALVLDAGAAGAQDIPLLDDPLNCTQAQEPFDGPQPVTANDTSTVQLSTQCFLVVGLEVPAGEAIGFTYLSGQFDSLNIAFYLPPSAPGASFHDPPNVLLGVPSARGSVPGNGTVSVIVAIQGVGGPNLGTAAVRVDTGDLPPSTTTTSTTTTTVAETTTTTTEAPTTTTTPATTEAPTTTADASTSTTTVEADAEQTTTVSEEADTTDEQNDDDAGASVGEAPAVDDGLPLWLVLLTVAAAVVAIGWLIRTALSKRNGAAVAAPWERPVISWTLQHSAPTGSCSSDARAIVDEDDDGSLDAYAVARLFSLPATGKRTRTSIGDPLLAQLETLYAGRGTGVELRSAVDAFVNTLTRHLETKKVPLNSTLLAELRLENAALIGETYACIDGQWRHYERWQEIPAIDNPAQHNIVQVVVLATGRTEVSEWTDRNDELSETISSLIAERRAPAGLWVFD
jgi:hypothetical protein